MKPFNKPFLTRVILAGILPGMFILTTTGCAEEQKTVKPEPIKYSTFSGLRDYGNKDGYEILSPVKLNQCMAMQEDFTAQKGALKDLQASIEMEKQAIEQQNTELNQQKSDLDKYVNADLVKRENYDSYNQARQDLNDRIAALRIKVQGYNNMTEEYRQKSLAYNQSVNSFNEACAIDKKLYSQDLQNVATN
ncbi:hypothetical protein THMIRHAS_13870 [Thiosulfatimonas sediminis]|uniref:Lipoprotein n=1 Tax=Thiosulfatimonas sediminis TaxID=2675054 RepID=A0A6F8PVI4_9GAMM|nr:hypothetical protein [Thiosulfatimonas sediminis]BBP46014.1 hypothetical protein THMIRHAS_13870 [Thiosulfatimonas sediminis]